MTAIYESIQKNTKGGIARNIVRVKARILKEVVGWHVGCFGRITVKIEAVRGCVCLSTHPAGVVTHAAVQGYEAPIPVKIRAVDPGRVGGEPDSLGCAIRKVGDSDNTDLICHPSPSPHLLSPLRNVASIISYVVVVEAVTRCNQFKRSG